MNIVTYEKMKGIPVSDWTLQECREADALIKSATLDNLRSKLHCDQITADFAVLMADLEFGCVEVDEFLLQLKAYPDWM